MVGEEEATEVAGDETNGAYHLLSPERQYDEGTH